MWRPDSGIAAVSSGCRRSTLSVIKNYTVRRIIFTIGALFLYVQATPAQSVLNFPRAAQDGKSATGIAVTNPTHTSVDVQFSYYGADGNVLTSGLLNPVSYRSRQKVKLRCCRTKCSAARQRKDGFRRQASASGLARIVVYGRFHTTARWRQLCDSHDSPGIPFLQEDPSRSTDILITNPGAQRASVSMTFYNEKGAEVATFNSDLVRMRKSGLIPRERLGKSDLQCAGCRICSFAVSDAMA